MYNIIPLILILVSLSIIITIVVRKFSVLANLDIDSIQAEREVKFKEQIIGNRLKRNYSKYYSKIMRVISPIAGFFGELLKKQYHKLIEIKETPTIVEKSNIISEKSIDILFTEAQEHIKKDELDVAEQKLIEIIGRDSKSIQAFVELGKLYFERKNNNEAEQTMIHALKLMEKEYDLLVQADQEKDQEKVNELKNQIASIYFDLSLVNRAQESNEKAIANIDKALKIEPNNPRYLDTKLEISIIKKDKILAQTTYERLQEANPENQKLEDIKKQIDDIE